MSEVPLYLTVCLSDPAVERICHIQDRHGQILALAFRSKSLTRLKENTCSLGSKYLFARKFLFARKRTGKIPVRSEAVRNNLTPP